MSRVRAMRRYLRLDRLLKAGFAATDARIRVVILRKMAGWARAFEADSIARTVSRDADALEHQLGAAKWYADRRREQDAADSRLAAARAAGVTGSELARLERARDLARYVD